MEADMLTSGVFQNAVEPFQHGVGRYGHILLHRGREHPAGMHRFLILPQDLHHRRRQDDLPDRVLRLRLAELQLSPHPVDLSAHIQHAGFKIQIIPLERHDLAPAQAGGKIQKEDLIASLCLGLDEKPLDLLTVQHLHLPRFLGRQFTAEGRIGADKPLLHRLLQRRTAGGMARSHHTVGKTLAIELDEGLPTVFLEPSIELLEVVWGQLVQRDVAQLGNDVQANAVFIAGLCSQTDLWLGVIFIPVFDPVPEAHIRLELIGLETAQLRPELFQFLYALFFRPGQNILCLGIALVIIADNIAPLPAPVGSLSYGSFAVFSFSCHGFNSFPSKSSMKPPTMPLAASLMSAVTWV